MRTIELKRALFGDYIGVGYKSLDLCGHRLEKLFPELKGKDNISLEISKTRFKGSIRFEFEDNDFLILGEGYDWAREYMLFTTSGFARRQGLTSGYLRFTYNEDGT
jgi:hypothetical protein